MTGQAIYVGAIPTPEAQPILNEVVPAPAPAPARVSTTPPADQADRNILHGVESPRLDHVAPTPAPARVSTTPPTTLAHRGIMHGVEGPPLTQSDVDASKASFTKSQN